VAEFPLVHVTGDQARLYVTVPGLDDSLWFLDTGYSDTTCDVDWVEGQGIPVRRALAWTRGGNGWARLQSARLPEFWLGEHLVGDLQCAVRDLQATSSIRDERVAGVLGTNLLRRFTVVLDTEDGVLRLHDPDELRVDEGIRFRSEFGSGRAKLPVDVGDERIWPLLDTGANGSRLPAEKLELELLAEQSRTWKATGRGGDVTRVVSFYEADDIGLGGVPSQRSLTVIGMDSRWETQFVGMDLIGGYNVTLDYRRRRALVEPCEPAELEVL
jgi:hypothetical protein